MDVVLRWLFLPAFALSLLLLGGCSANGTRFQGLSAVDAGTAEIIVYRPDRFVHGGVPYYVILDDKEVGTLRNAGFMSVKPSPGQHILKVQAGYEDLYREVKTNISVVQGERKLFRFEPSLSGGPIIIPGGAYVSVAIGLWQVDEPHALNDLQDLKLSN